MQEEEFYLSHSLPSPFTKLCTLIKNIIYWTITVITVVFITAILTLLVRPQTSSTIFPFLKDLTAEPVDDATDIDVDNSTEGYMSDGHDPENNSTLRLCKTRACRRQAKNISGEVDYSINPCSDFYQFACSKWIERHPVTNDRESISVDSVILDHFTNMVAKFMTSPNPEVKNTRFLYETCLHPNKSLFEEVRKTFFYVLGIQDWPYLGTSLRTVTKNEVSAKIGALSHELGLDSLFHFKIVADPENDTKRYIALEEPSLVKGYFQGPLSDHSYLTEAFRTLMDHFNKICDTNVALLESDLSNRMTGQPLRCATLKNCPAMRIKNFPVTNNINWKVMTENFLGYESVSGDDLVLVPPLNYIVSLAARRNQPRRNDILNYIIFRIMMALSPFIANETLRHKLASIAYARQPEFSHKLPSNHYCIRFLDRFEPYVPMMLSYDQLVDHIGYDVLQFIVIDLIRRTFEQYLYLLKSLSSKFRTSFVRKLSHIRWQPLMPSVMVDKEFRRKYIEGMYNNNPISPPSSFLFYWIRTAIQRRHVQYTVSDDDLWPGWTKGFLRTYPNLEAPYRSLEIPFPVFNIFLHNESSVHHLQIPRVATRIYYTLFKFMFQYAYSFYFSNNSSDTVSALENMRTCVKRQYAQSRPYRSDISSPNNDETSLSDLLDVLAIRPSYRTFYRLMLKKKDFRFSDAKQFSGKQLFFIYYALSMCENYNPAYLKKLMKQGPWSPAHMRVNGPLRNMEEFANAFQCPLGSYMNPPRKCSL